MDVDTNPRARPVRVGRARNGGMVYLVDRPPAALPPVLRRDLEAAWDAAREAAVGAVPGAPRVIRFRRPGGGETTLRLEDRDARCWAAAVERLRGLGDPYGLSLCLRLLALVDLLARASWTASLCTLRRDSAALHPALLRAASAAPLSDDASFDEARLRAGLVLPFARPFLAPTPGARP